MTTTYNFVLKDNKLDLTQPAINIQTKHNITSTGKTVLDKANILQLNANIITSSFLTTGNITCDDFIINHDLNLTHNLNVTENVNVTGDLNVGDINAQGEIKCDDVVTNNLHVLNMSCIS